MKTVLLKDFILEVLKHDKKSFAGSYPDEAYHNGHIDDMMLDKEGWVTDPNDRKKIKQWYLNMGLAHKQYN